MANHGSNSGGHSSVSADRIRAQILSVPTKKGGWEQHCERARPSGLARMICLKKVQSCFRRKRRTSQKAPKPMAPTGSPAPNSGPGAPGVGPGGPGGLNLSGSYDPPAKAAELRTIKMPAASAVFIQNLSPTHRFD